MGKFTITKSDMLEILGDRGADVSDDTVIMAVNLTEDSVEIRAVHEDLPAGLMNKFGYFRDSCFKKTQGVRNCQHNSGYAVSDFANHFL